MENKIIGYKIIPDFREAFSKIINFKLDITNLTMDIDSDAYKKAVELKVLDLWFEPVYEKDKFFDLSKLKVGEDPYYIFTNESSKLAGFDGNNFLQIHLDGLYRNKGFYLNPSYNWEIVKDDEGFVLLPTKKIK